MRYPLRIRFRFRFPVTGSHHTKAQMAKCIVYQAELVGLIRTKSSIKHSTTEAMLKALPVNPNYTEFDGSRHAKSMLILPVGQRGRL